MLNNLNKNTIIIIQFYNSSISDNFVKSQQGGCNLCQKINALHI
jgi:hypothetical protein